jgi:hypothetical protein
VAGAKAPERAAARWLVLLLAAMLLGALVTFAWRNLPYAGLWYDEAVQFWISRGVNPFAAPGGEPGGVRAVIQENSRANLDPGGFSLLLHLWMRGGTDPRWLRILPFGLFLTGIAAMARLGWVWRPRPLFAMLSAAVPLGFPLLLYHATEVRAYTMEFAGVALGCLLLSRLQAGAGIAGFALTGATLAVFMSSRYSYAIFTAAMCLVLAHVVRSGSAGDARARRRRLLALGLPILLGTAFVALNFSLQRWRLTAEGGMFVRYLVPATAAGKSWGDLLTALARNLLHPVGIPVTLAAVVVLLPPRWRARCPARFLGIGASHESRVTYWLAAGVLALSLALWRWHPWDVTQKWSLFLHALSAVLTVRIVADVLAWLDVPGRSGRWTRAICTTGCALLAIALSAHAATKRRVHSNDLTAVLQYLEREPLAPGSVAVTIPPYPVLRYMCEQGPFSGRLPYPAAFRLPHAGGPQPLVGPETRFLIAYGRPPRVVTDGGVSVRTEPSWPAHLYAVARPRLR